MFVSMAQQTSMIVTRSWARPALGGTFVQVGHASAAAVAAAEVLAQLGCGPVFGKARGTRCYRSESESFFGMYTSGTWAVFGLERARDVAQAADDQGNE